MKLHQEEFGVQTRGRGLFEITGDVAAIVDRSAVRQGIVNVFCRHTSCSLVLMENADPSAQRDLEAYFSRLVKDGDPAYVHRAEGPDDMSAHIRMALTRTSETIPVSRGQLVLGTWQGIFLWEHRTTLHHRKLMISVTGDS